MADKMDEVENSGLPASVRDYLRTEVSASAGFTGRVMEDIYRHGPHAPKHTSSLENKPVRSRVRVAVFTTAGAIAAALLIAVYTTPNRSQLHLQRGDRSHHDKTNRGTTFTRTSPKRDNPASTNLEPASSTRISNSGIRAPEQAHTKEPLTPPAQLSRTDTVRAAPPTIAYTNPAPTVAALDKRLSGDLRLQIETLADSISSVGLPAKPLIDKALEGAAKGIDDTRILAAVRNTAAKLAAARNALGTISPDELAAAATALDNGARSQEIVTMRNTLRGRNLVVPYTVLSTLVSRGLPATEAASIVVAQAKQSDDRALSAFGRDVENRVAKGLSVRTAVVEVITQLTPASGSPTPRAPKTKP